mmetsp:Transcript_5498/g.11976  ORF Transcript_5498/g.11976 Transcript_5498/m.11976 type:complete len:236 (-) Transcript_5498:1134-1841(-)
MTTPEMSTPPIMLTTPSFARSLINLTSKLFPPACFAPSGIKPTRLAAALYSATFRSNSRYIASHFSSASFSAAASPSSTAFCLATCSSMRDLSRSILRTSSWLSSWPSMVFRSCSIFFVHSLISFCVVDSWFVRVSTLFVSSALCSLSDSIRLRNFSILVAYSSCFCCASDRPSTSRFNSSISSLILPHSSSHPVRYASTLSLSLCSSSSSAPSSSSHSSLSSSRKATKLFLRNL